MMKTRIINISLIIPVPYTMSYSSRRLDNDEILKNAAEILDQVKRHVDYGKNASIAQEKESICSYCGAPWIDVGLKHNGCCEEDKTE